METDGNQVIGEAGDRPNIFHWSDIEELGGRKYFLAKDLDVEKQETKKNARIGETISLVGE